jgi:hypothetical protein
MPATAARNLIGAGEISAVTTTSSWFLGRSHHGRHLFG